MHHFFFFSLYLAWLGGWINPVQLHFQSLCHIKLNFHAQLGTNLGVAIWLSFIRITDLLEETDK